MKINDINHVAIIMDGNGRWAEQHNLPRFSGHKKGLDVIPEVVKELINNKIKYITLFAFSTENNFRPKEEKENLLNLLEFALNKVAKEIRKNKIKLSFIGEIEYLPKHILKKIENITKNYDLLYDAELIIAWNYGGRQEIINAVNKLIKQNINNVDEKQFEKLLYTSEVPNPDLIIRTGGQKRISNFMLWQSAYSEMYFTSKLWPDFNKKDVIKALNDFKKRNRNYGKTN
ncbi:MAG: di-trans,poly-cis-decaprenylcistransferase [Chloroflexi bacterium]|jgi:undecaprenyl diphosphate synthase|nr:di-trans,poly-cis-decaprenylcistransferase [Chloroflexota bacterium]|tara:strand:- start:598 stop:1287 length:690 start_codon:yes stop_codon:yes gene_type:complete